MRFPCLRLLAASGCAAGLSRAASFDARVESLFRPEAGEMMALSPDGQRVAYTLPTDGKLTLVILDVERPGTKPVLVPVEFRRDAAGAEVEPPARLRFLRWATASRLVYAPAERLVPLPPVTGKDGRSEPNPDGPTILAPIMAVDADGRQRGTVVDARDFQETPAEARASLADLLRTPAQLAALRRDPIHWRMPHLDVLGFLPQDRTQLVIATHGAYSVPAQYLVDIRVGNVREFGGDWPAPPGEPEVYDWFRRKVVGERLAAARPATVWRDDDLAHVQRNLATKFPERIVELLDWSDTHSRVLLRVTGGSDPGRVFVFQRLEDLALEIFRCAPWLTAATLNATRWFEFAAADGAHLSGYLTWPRDPGTAPPPLLVVFSTGFPGHAQPAFDPGAQVFADLGFAVLRLNHRSVAGVRTEDVPALRAAVDRAAVDDAQAAIDWIATQNPERRFDRGRIATLGRGFGGYLALRALQLQPAAFRCGIAIDAPPDLRPWLQAAEAAPAAGASRDIPAELFDHAQTDWKKLSVLDQAEALTNPVLLVDGPSRQPAVDAATDELCRRLAGLGHGPERIAFESAASATPPESRAAVYRKIGDFLNRSLRDAAPKAGLTGDAP